MKSKKFMLFMVFALAVSLSAAAVILYGYTIELPKTGQTGCWDEAGVSRACAGTGEDADATKPGGIAGAAWPASRFTVATSTITDTLTGLMWVRAANTLGVTSGGADCSAAGARNWQNALKYVKCANAASYLGYTDWRLPNVLELNSLYNVGIKANDTDWFPNVGGTGIGFTGVQVNYYWAADTYIAQPAKPWAVHFRLAYIREGGAGSAGDAIKTTGLYYIWPVRGGSI